MRNIGRIAVLPVLALALAQPLAAQGGGGRGSPPVVRDTTPGAVRPTPDGTVMDFNNQDLTQVLRAIAEAGNLQVVFTSMPRVNVTLRIQLKMTATEARDILKSVAEINKVEVKETPSIITLVGPPPPPPPTAPVNAQLQALLAQQNRVLTVNVIRLKHQTASTLAPVLMGLFTGSGTGAGGVNNAAGGRGIGGINTNIGGGNAGGRGGNAGGRGGNAGGRGGNAGGLGGITGIGGLGGINLGGGAGGLGAALLGAGGLGIIRPFSDMRIMPEQTTNSLLVFSTQEDFAVVQTLVTGIDIRPLQVLVEVTIAQVQRTHDLDVGISGLTTKTKGSGTTATTDTTALLPSAASALDFVAKLTGGHGAIDYSVALNALATRGEVRVLSLPVIIAQNNIQAIISVGSQVPFVSVSQTVPNDPTGRVQTIQYQNVGTTLTILPTINPDGYVNLTVDQTNNDVTSNLLFDAPIINNREATTQILIKDGQTTVIGGLADNTEDNTTSGIPILSKIPIIGTWLFGNTTHHKDATELYLFLTPHVISTDDDIDKVRNALKSSSELLNNVPLHALDPKTNGDTLFIGKPPAAKKPPPPDAPDAKKPPAKTDSTSFQPLR